MTQQTPFCEDMLFRVEGRGDDVEMDGSDGIDRRFSNFRRLIRP